MINEQWRKLKNSGIILHQSHNLINNNSLEEYPCPFISMPVHFLLRWNTLISRDHFGADSIFIGLWLLLPHPPQVSGVWVGGGQRCWHSLCSASRHLHHCLPLTLGARTPQSSRFCWRSQVPLLLLSSFSRVRLCATPETAAQQAPPSLGFSRQEHWSGLPFPSPKTLRFRGSLNNNNKNFLCPKQSFV